MSPASSIRSPRNFESATFTAPAGSTPTARAAASAASALRAMCADVNGTVRPGGSASTSPPGPNVTVVTSARRWASSSGSPAGTIAVAPGASPAASSVPGCAQRAASACSGPTRTPHAPLASACGAKRPPSTLPPLRPTNRSPAPTSRESMTTRAGPAACGAGATRRAPAAWAMRSGDQSRTERLAGDGDVVEGHLVPVGELLALLVALAGDDHDVAPLGDADPALDRGATVDLDLHARAAAIEDRGDDRLRVLAARVVGGDDHDVG